MKIKNNLISGFFASIGGVLTKVAFSFSSDGPISSYLLPNLENKFPEITDKNIFGTPLLLILKIALHILLMVIGVTTSGLMYTYYMASMQENGAARATVYNFCVNFIGSIIFGAIFFQE